MFCQVLHGSNTIVNHVVFLAGKDGCPILFLIINDNISTKALDKVNFGHATIIWHFGSTRSDCNVAFGFLGHLDRQATNPTGGTQNEHLRSFLGVSQGFSIKGRSHSSEQGLVTSQACKRKAHNCLEVHTIHFDTEFSGYRCILSKGTRRPSRSGSWVRATFYQPSVCNDLVSNCKVGDLCSNALNGPANIKSGCVGETGNGAVAVQTTTKQLPVNWIHRSVLYL
mmetsp:Transcript_18396/g.33331  ORF Transcript_18396/g.33331 Transcript_18396/m.33331 type:complete len:225 (-) Transcript_18396:275-949(-)